MNNSFSISRFALLLKKDFTENIRLYAIGSVSLLFGLATLMVLGSPLICLPAEEGGAIFATFPIYYLFCLSLCIAASMMFPQFRTKQGRLSVFMLPATNAEKYAEQMKNIDMFYDMYAAADEGLVTINVVIQNLGVLYGAAISEEKFIELSLEGLDEQLGSAGFVLQGNEVGTMTFAGEERTALHISCTYQDVPYYCQQIIIKQGEYMSIITLASFYEDNTASMVDYFYAVG